MLYCKWTVVLDVHVETALNLNEVLYCEQDTCDGSSRTDS